MIINEIQLTNIGAYRGINSFDFRTTENKNVILIGGENGAGKTTLLNAIKLGLFGSYGYGFKSDNAEYFKRVLSTLNHNAKKINENNFRIKLDFTLIDNYEKVNYTLYRYWKQTNKNLKEYFDLVANGKHYSDYEKEIFQSKLKEIMPPQLLELCLFDGEEISRIVNEDLLSDYLRNLSRVVFNLDLFETLEEDLELYSNQNLDLKKMESNERNLFELNKREKELKKEIIPKQTSLDDLINQRAALIDRYQILKVDFEKYGGLVKSERDSILRKINQIEMHRKNNAEKIRDFVSSLLPFYLAKNLLSETRQQIQNEESLHLFKQLDSKLTSKKIKDILNVLPGSSNLDASDLLKEEILKLMKPEKEIIQIHGASFSENSLIENIFNSVSSNKDQTTTTIIEENRNKLLELQVFRTKLKVNDSTTEFSDMIGEMEEIQKSLLNTSEEISVLEKELTDLKNSLTKTISDIDKLQHSLKDIDKTKSSFLESQKIIALSRRFRELQLKKKLQEVQIEASSMLKRIFRKHNYVSSIQIDHQSYNVILIDSNKDLIDKSTLSAGEKEILLISIIWAIFKCSGRKVPFIFDTLLGRLDKTHKAAVLTEFIPNSGRQAIILSTDSEIDDFHYSLLEKNISQEYMLDFNVERKETKILNQYFTFSKKELVR